MGLYVHVVKTVHPEPSVHTQKGHLQNKNVLIGHDRVCATPTPCTPSPTSLSV